MKLGTQRGPVTTTWIHDLRYPIENKGYKRNKTRNPFIVSNLSDFAVNETFRDKAPIFIGLDCDWSEGFIRVRLLNGGTQFSQDRTENRRQ